MFKRDNGCAEAALLVLLIPVVFVTAVVASGYALSVLWGWFVSSIFDLPTLSVPVAIGISMIVRFTTYTGTTGRESTRTDQSVTGVVVEAVVGTVARPAFALFFGWIVHQFM